MEYKKPISVVMPTYNTLVPILKEAVDSILNQTFREFEFIIIDDGSTDASAAYLQNLRDKRIRLIRNPAHLGTTKSLNIGFEAAQGKYIARMDSDDISLPSRLEKQFAFMEKHADVILCGANVSYFGMRKGVSEDRNLGMAYYRINALFCNPGPKHPTAFFNHELLSKYHLSYQEELVYAQDYGLYAEISRLGKVYILKDVLLRHRTHDLQVSKKHREKQIACDKITMRKLLQELLGTVSDEELDLHYDYATGYRADIQANMEMKRWFRRLVDANNHRGIYNRWLFKYYVYDVVVKRTVYQSFSHDESLFSRISLFFRYLPFPIAVKASLGMTGREIIGHLSQRKRQ